MVKAIQPVYEYGRAVAKIVLFNPNEFLTVKLTILVCKAINVYYYYYSDAHVYYIIL